MNTLELQNPPKVDRNDNSRWCKQKKRRVMSRPPFFQSFKTMYFLFHSYKFKSNADKLQLILLRQVGVM
jgi:hypothetical protein